MIDRLQTLAKKHMVDLLFIAAFAAVIPAFMVNKPEMNYNSRAHYNNPAAIRRGVKPVVQRETRAADDRVAREYKRIEEHNIFAPTGSYDSAKYKNPAALPPNPYRLVAVLVSGVKRAVFSLYTGEMVSLKEGDELLDGSVIKAIGPTSVTLVQGKTKREMKILTVEKKGQRS